MTTYAIGDIQGCFDSFLKLLAEIQFNHSNDRLWLLGDLINRGPKSLEVLNFVRSLGTSAITVLGNHDLHFLAIFYAGHSVRPNDTFDKLLESDEVAGLANWLRHQKFFHLDQKLGYAMSHAGIPHIWNLFETKNYARELEQVLSADTHLEYFQHMYGNKPDCWREGLSGMDRWRCLTNYLTRMRWINSAGALEFASKGPVSDCPAGYQPWFDHPRQTELGQKIVFGHWAALEGGTGNYATIALDTGCVWGGRLTALCLETGIQTSVPAQEK